MPFENHPYKNKPEFIEVSGGFQQPRDEGGERNYLFMPAGATCRLESANAQIRIPGIELSQSADELRDEE